MTLGLDEHETGCHWRKKRRHKIPLPERGWIKFLLLRLIYEQPMHGYKLMDKMVEKGFVSPGRFRTGSIYTILNRMEMAGLLTSVEELGEEGRRRRTYSITNSGAKALRNGLRSVLQRKRVMDELEAFYKEQFGDKPDETKGGE